VCAAVGRATNTDPVLWRVLLAVLTIFGGVGLLIYLVGWLLIPSEGDTGSAAEALLGRGRSSTSVAAVILAAILIVTLTGIVFSNGPRPAMLGVALIAGAALLLFRRGNLGSPPAPPTSGAAGYPSVLYPGAPDYLGPPVSAPAPTSGQPATVPVTNVSPQPVPVPPLGGYEPPLAPVAGYRPPFAPHGPYASSSPYAASLGYPSTAPLPAYPGLGGVPVPPPPPRPPRPRSRLGRVTFSLLLVALGLLAVFDLAVGGVRGMSYVAVALATIGLGLVIGGWFGRARWLIAPGIALVIALAAGSAAQGWSDSHAKRVQVWQPATVAEINDTYHLDVGSATLDLTHVDFTDHTVTIHVSVDVGNLVVTLPPNVDANVDVRVDLGDATVLGDHVGGADRSRSVKDNGADGPGGGQVNIDANVSLGKLEVTR
jgi:phage shock protein PspC (stress-responsive transcriptional regulator)